MSRSSFSVLADYAFKTTLYAITTVYINTDLNKNPIWKLLRSDKVKLANITCAATALPTVKSKFLNCLVESCPFCGTRCKPGEYNLVLKVRVSTISVKNCYLNITIITLTTEYGQLMKVTNKLLKNLATYLHSIITRCS